MIQTINITYPVHTDMVDRITACLIYPRIIKPNEILQSIPPSIVERILIAEVVPTEGRARKPFKPRVPHIRRLVL